MHASAHASLVLVTVLFSGWHILGRLVLSSKGTAPSPIVFACMRELGAAVCFLIFALCVEGARFPERRHWLRFFLLGTVGTFVNQVPQRRAPPVGAAASTVRWSSSHRVPFPPPLSCQVCFVLGLKWTSASAAASYIPLQPIVVSILVMTLGIERPQSRRDLAQKLGAILLATSGAMVMLASESEDDMGKSEHQMLGRLLLFLAVCSFSVFLLAQKAMLAIYPPISCTAWGYFVGGVEMIIASVWIGETDLLGKSLPITEWHAHIWVALAYVMFFATFCTYMLITWANKVGSSVTVSLYACLQPLTTTAMSMLLLHERIGWAQVLGAAGIISGLVLHATSEHAGGAADGKPMTPLTSYKRVATDERLVIGEDSDEEDEGRADAPHVSRLPAWASGSTFGSPKSKPKDLPMTPIV